MFHSKLRRAIAQAFPDRYNRFTWRNLLADFVDVHAEAYLTLRDRYEQERVSNPEAAAPFIRPEFKQAVTLLAQQQRHTYPYLAITQYLLQWEVAALRKENDHLSEQVAGYEQVMLGYQRLSNQAIATLNNNDNL